MFVTAVETGFFFLNQCFLHTEHLITAKVYCTITEATRKSLFQQHWPIKAHLKQELFIRGCATERLGLHSVCK